MGSHQVATIGCAFGLLLLSNATIAAPPPVRSGTRAAQSAGSAPARQPWTDGAPSATLGEHITDVSVGGLHACVATASGGVRCWGSNEHGELGDGTDAMRTRPVAVLGVSHATQVSAGSNHTCVLRQDGTVGCWGDNSTGQLGDGTTNSATATRRAASVTAVHDAVQVSAGADKSCARLRNGHVVCWGGGDLPTARQGVATEITGSRMPSTLPRVWQEAARCERMETSRAGREATRRPMCPGSRTRFASRSRARAVRSGPDRAVAAAVGPVAEMVAHACAALASGDVVCWGDDQFGALGGSPGATPLAPVAAAGVSDAIDVVAGGAHSCALRRSGDVVCWGRAPVATSSATVRVQGAAQIASDGANACARLRSGAVVCWGNNAAGQLGTGRARSRPAQRWSRESPTRDP